MSKVWTRNLSDQGNVEMEIDLVELLGQFTDSSSVRQAVGQKVIDIIRDRTQKDQRSWTGAAFKNYSPEYVDSVEFKAYGKEKGEPNLTQTGDMLGLMTVREGKDPGRIVIAWDDKLQSEKAHGHITGGVGVKRDFLGLTLSEIDDIKQEFRDETIAPESENSDEKFSEFTEGRKTINQESLDEILGEFFQGDE